MMYSVLNIKSLGVRVKERGVYHLSICSALCRTLLLLLVAAGLFASCTGDESTSEFSEGRDAVIRFQINADTPKNAATRSVDEDKISDLHVLVYNSAGELTGKSYTTFSGTTYTVSVLARSGTGCKIYAIANTGTPTLFDGTVASTETKLKAITTNLATWNTFNNTSGTVYLPMSGSVTTDILAGTTSLQGGITVKRLMARITLNVGIASGSGIIISGYRIYGIPGKSYYIAHPLDTEENTDRIDTQTTRATDASLPANSGDWTNSGQIALSNVTSFNTSFYMYENRPGVNTSISLQNQKIKANVPATPADSAAYVMIYGKGGGYSSLSWKVYLGGNNTTNFNIKRNCTYTCIITLKPNTSDTRITYNPKLIWAGSNIYWNGTKLTFDAAPADPANPTTAETDNMTKQGVFFMWGSLIGISPNGSSYGSSVLLYIPSYVSGGSSSWTGTTTGSSMVWAKIPYMTDGSSTDQTNTFLNNAEQNTTANYEACKGDICQYLSKTGAVNGSWRMPTAKEFNTTNTNTNTGISWGTTSTTTWKKYGAFPGTSSGIANGQSPISWGATYTYNGSGTSFPASGYREYTNGTLYNVGRYGCYWSSSAGGTTYGFYLYFDSDYVYPAYSYYRQFGLPVRCVRN